jgi:hypothetical protein
MEVRLRGQVDGALGEQHVGPEVAVRPGPPAAPCQRHEGLQAVAVLPLGEGGVGQRRVVEPRDVRDVALRRLHQGPAGPGPAARRRPPAALEQGGRHDAEDHLVLHHQRDQRGPDRHAAHEVLRPVDRVHDPPALAVAGGAVLLPEHGVPRPRARQGPADALLHGLVGVGHRSEVRLVDHMQVQGPEAARGCRVGVVGQDVREPQVVGVGGGHAGQAKPRTTRSPAIGGAAPRRV